MYISYIPAPQPSVFMVSFTYLPLTFDFVSYTDDEEEGDSYSLSTYVSHELPSEEYSIL